VGEEMYGFCDSALGVSHVMRYINLRYLLTYLLEGVRPTCRGRAKRTWK